MARPKKKPEARKVKDLRIRVTPEQHRLIMEAVGDDEMSDWARSVLLQAARDRIAGDQRKKPVRKGKHED